MERSTTLARKSSVDKKPFKTIVVVNIDNEILHKDLLFTHFSKFGRISKMHLSSKDRNAMISYTKPSEARAAKEKGGEVMPNVPPVKIYFSEKGADGSRVRGSNLASSSSRISKTPKSPITLTPSNPPVPLFPQLQQQQQQTQPIQQLSQIQSITSGGSQLKVSSPVKLKASTSSNISVKASRLGPQNLNQQQKQQEDQHSFYPDTPEAQELFAKRAVTAEERYRLLEARDKLIRAKNPKVKMRVELAVKLRGTCRDMCPEKERYMREAQRQLTSYEMKPGKDAEVDHRLAIKGYSRSSADQEEPLPHELRPTPTLEMSLSYILHNIIPRMEMEGADLADLYTFIWDRTRSIRKDITQQQLCDLRAVAIMEKCARFHIHCSSRLCELDRHAFDMKLNDENLMKCLQSLEHMYTDLNLMGVKCPNEPEFRAYQILMNLNEGDILWEIQQKPDWVRESPQVQFAIKIHMAVFEKNYAQFFKLVRGSPYLTACILHRYFFQVRSTALRTIFKAYSIINKSETYTSLSAVARVLGFSQDNSEMFRYFCNAHGVDCDFEKDRITLSRKNFDMPDSPSIGREHYLIESKLTDTLMVIINGGPLGKNPYPDHCPHTSFDEQGYLIQGDLVGVPESKLLDGTILRNKAIRNPPQVFPSPSLSSTSSLSPSTSSSVQQPHSVGGFKFPSTTTAPTTITTITTSSHSIIRQSFMFGTPSMTSQQQQQSTTTSPSSFSSISATSASSSSPTSGFSFLQQLSSAGSNPPSIIKPSQSIFGGGGASSVPPVKPSIDFSSTPSFASSNASSFGFRPSSSTAPSTTSVLEQQQQQQQTARRQEMKILKSSSIYFEKMLNSEIKRIIVTMWKKAELHRRIKVQQRQLDVDRGAVTIYSRVENKAIKEKLMDVVKKTRTRDQTITQKSKGIAVKILDKTVLQSIQRICQQCFAQAQREREYKIKRLEIIRLRILLRRCVRKWKQFLNKVKLERQILVEKKLKELENFPSYQNTVLSSPEDILMAWCGSRESGSSRVPTRKSLSPLQNKVMELSSAQRCISTPSKVKDQVDGDTSEEEKLNGMRKIIECYDFPSYSNTDNMSPASILSSWCGGLNNYNYNNNVNIIIPSSIATSPLSSSETGPTDFKKRRLDQGK